MSYRLGQSKARFNFNPSVGENPAPKNGQNSAQGSTLPAGSSIFSGTGSHAAGIVHSSTFLASHGSKHKGHRRGHSYGGVINPPTHHHLESRPSHPNTNHGYAIFSIQSSFNFPP